MDSHMNWPPMAAQSHPAENYEEQGNLKKNVAPGDPNMTVGGLRSPSFLAK